MQRKAFSILRCLVEHPARLVTKQELLERFWSGLHVDEGVLKLHVSAIRQALGDAARAPRYIETAHGLGYRFIGHIESCIGASAASAGDGEAALGSTRTSLFVGRKSELEHLALKFERAAVGERQLTFVTGEPGIGKSTLMKAFLAQLAPERAWLAWGQCASQFDGGDPYLPVLEALGRLCQQPHGELVADTLRANGPTWLPQALGLSERTEVAAMDLVARPGMQQATLREMAQTLEALGRLRTLVMVLEDLHWADHATLDLINYLARRTDSARVLILATFRPFEILNTSHRLTQVHDDLKQRNLCSELALPRLDQRAVSEYLTQRFPLPRLPMGLPELVYQRAEGNPLFMVRIVETWLTKGLLKDTGALATSLEELSRHVPETVTRIIECEIERLSEFERSVLEAGSVAGAEFPTAAVAAALDEDLVRVDELCRRWARRGQFLRSRGKSEWHDGTVSERCAFSHVLYQHVLYDQMGLARRNRLHRRIGERLEAAYGENAGDIAAELALHFARGSANERATHYLRVAGKHSLRRSAYQEALHHFQRAMSLLEKLPPAADRRAIELELHVLTGPALALSRGYGTPEVEQTYARAAELCRVAEQTLQLAPVMLGMASFQLMHGAVGRSLELCSNLLELAERHQDAVAITEAHLLMGIAYHHRAEYALSVEHLEKTRALHEPTQRHERLGFYGYSPVEFAQPFLAVNSCLTGQHDRAVRVAEAVLRGAREREDATCHALALGMSAVVYHLQGGPRLAYERAELLEALSRNKQLVFYLGMAKLLKGVSSLLLGAPNAVSLLEAGWSEQKAIGCVVYGVHWLSMLAAAYGKSGQVERGLELLDAGMSEASQEERCWQAERELVRAELLEQLVPRPVERIEACLSNALEIAQRQGEKLFALRAATGLCKLWRLGRRDVEGRALLSNIYSSFTEGFDTPALVDARAIGAELPSGGLSAHGCVKRA